MARKRKHEPAAAAPEGWTFGGGDKMGSTTWLWEPWIPSDSLSLICGEAQLGKSTLLAYLAAGVTRRPRPAGRKAAPPASVLWIPGEESWGAATAPRLLAAGADLSRVIRPDRNSAAGGRVSVHLLAGQMPDLVAAGVALVVVDPVAALSEEGSDWRNEGAARACLDALQLIAGEHKLPVLGTRNWNKRKDGSRLDRISGSHAFRDVPRAIVSVIPDPLVAARYLACLDKWSYGPGARPRSYTLDRNDPTGVPVWKDLGESEHDPDDLDGDRPRGAARAQWRAAHTLLRAAVPPEGIEARKLQAEAKLSGIPPTTLWRAACELKVRRERTGFGPGGFYMWYPPAKGWPEDLPLEPIRGKERGGGVGRGLDEKQGAPSEGDNGAP